MPKWAKILTVLITAITLIIIAFILYVSATFISKDEVKKRLIDHINVNAKKIYFEKIDLEIDTKQYEIDFYYNNTEYEAKINAKNGKIIYTNFANDHINENVINNSPTEKEEKEKKEINLETAKNIALKHANLKENNVTLVKAHEEVDNGKIIYEIEYKDTTYEYDFDISKTGQILKYDKDKLID